MIFVIFIFQGILIQRQQERDHQQEKIDKSRHMPFHMHINLELLECVYLVSAMLLEIPYMACKYPNGLCDVSNTLQRVGTTEDSVDCSITSSTSQEM